MSRIPDNTAPTRHSFSDGVDQLVMTTNGLHWSAEVSSAGLVRCVLDSAEPMPLDWRRRFNRIADSLRAHGVANGRAVSCAITCVLFDERHDDSLPGCKGENRGWRAEFDR